MDDSKTGTGKHAETIHLLHHAASHYSLFQKKCKMDSFIFPGVQGQGHVTMGHAKQARWS